MLLKTHLKTGTEITPGIQRPPQKWHQHRVSAIDEKPCFLGLDTGRSPDWPGRAPRRPCRPSSSAQATPEAHATPPGLHRSPRSPGLSDISTKTLQQDFSGSLSRSNGLVIFVSRASFFGCFKFGCVWETLFLPNGWCRLERPEPDLRSVVFQFFSTEFRQAFQ